MKLQIYWVEIMVIEKKIEELVDLILSSDRIVAFTGAGISTGAGIPDFRSPGGLWEKFDPDLYATWASFQKNPARFWERSEQDAHCFTTERRTPESRQARETRQVNSSNHPKH
ncbi:MAG: Sir2 family NAD-dependent protein deacetylase [Candidatus Hodarchaeales archaeon]